MSCQVFLQLLAQTRDKGVVKCCMNLCFSVSLAMQKHPKSSTDSAEEVDQDIAQTRRSAGNEALVELVANRINEDECHGQRCVTGIKAAAGFLG